MTLLAYIPWQFVVRWNPWISFMWAAPSPSNTWVVGEVSAWSFGSSFQLTRSQNGRARRTVGMSFIHFGSCFCIPCSLPCSSLLSPKLCAAYSLISRSFVFSYESFMTVLIRAVEHIPDLLPVDLCPFISVFFFFFQAVSLLLCCAIWTCFHFILGIPLQSSIVGDLCPHNIGK